MGTADHAEESNWVSDKVRFAWSPGHRNLFLRARRVAACDEPILVEGESGTGKTILAEQIHYHSLRKDREPIKLGCGEVEGNLLGSTLFGYRKGAFTGAETDRAGLLKAAHGSTLILDDIDYLPQSYQSRLLRFLDDGYFIRLGEPDKRQTVDVRLIVTTNKCLETLAKEGRFLPDLYFRIKCWRLKTLPLRKRPEDIPILANLFLQQFIESMPKHMAKLKFDSDALELLALLTWPGNLRELKQGVKNIALFHEEKSSIISLQSTASVLFDGIYGTAQTDLQEDESLHRILLATGWNYSLTSRVTGLARNTIAKRISVHGWQRP